MGLLGGGGGGGGGGREGVHRESSSLLYALLTRDRNGNPQYGV